MIFPRTFLSFSSSPLRKTTIITTARARFYHPVSIASSSSPQWGGVTPKLSSQFPVYQNSPIQSTTIRQFSALKDKLTSAFEEYRLANYRQALPSRFAKEIVDTADVNKDGVVTSVEIMRILENIGAKDQFTEDEIHQVLIELGEEESDKTHEIGVPNAKVAAYLIGK